MAVLVTYVNVNQRGQINRDRKRIDAAVLNLGRGSQCEIHLPDPRVALVHARITVSEAGGSIEADAGRIEVNGRQVETAMLAVGDRIEVSPYVLQVEAPPEGVPLALTVTQSEPSAPRRLLSLRRLLRRAPPISKRRLSYLATGAILLFFLGIPLASDLLHDSGWGISVAHQQAMGEIVHKVSGKFIQMWNPGTLSRSHQAFADDCRACHEFPFVQVRDFACIECHKTIKEHVPRAMLTGVQGAALVERRCAQCHLDHKGVQMAPRAQEQCADCHRDVKSAAPKAASENVTDFGADHPAFRLTLLDADKPELIRRVRQAKTPPAEMAERSNLKFNHELHLDPTGVRDPEGRRDAAGMRDARGVRTVLKCENCHQPADGGRLMAAVSMDRHCRQCHSLAFEPRVSGRQVPHGSEEEITTMLREFYARLVLGDVPPGVNPPADLHRIRPGEALTYEDRQRVLQVADRKTQQALRELFETREVCATCHYVDRKRGGAGWKVRPVALASVWMPQALFTHARHATQACAICHAVANSTDAEDVAMPNIAKCRECHVGARPVRNKVASDCASCHKFHAGGDYWHGKQQAQRLPRETR